MVQWKSVGNRIEGQKFFIDGINVWEHDWIPIQGQRAIVGDQTYGPEHSFRVFEIKTGKITCIFAAGERSANWWEFYIPISDNQ